MDRSKFYLSPKNPNRFVDVEVWVDWSEEEPRVLSNRCIFIQGETPCMGNKLKPCNGKYSLCNHHNRDQLCTDELGKLEFVAANRKKFGESDSEMPDTIKKEWARFNRPMYGQKSYVRQMSKRIDLQTQRVIFDQYRNEQYILKSLLVDWSLKDIDPDLQIKQVIEGANMGFEVIPNQQMKLINKVSGELIDSFVSEFKAKTRWT